MLQWIAALLSISAYAQQSTIERMPTSKPDRFVTCQIKEYAGNEFGIWCDDTSYTLMYRSGAGWASVNRESSSWVAIAAFLRSPLSQNLPLVKE